jgi:ribokinase
MADVVVVGSYNTGITVRGQRLPAPGETVIGNQFHQGPGGKGANQAIGASRLGADVLFIGKVGNDEFGDAARALFAAEGMPDDGISTADSHTGVALIMVDELGGNLISVAPGANLRMTSAEVLKQHAQQLSDAKFVLMQLECSTELAAGVLEWAYAAGKQTILNPAPARPVEPDLLASLDYLTPNEGELRTLCTSLGVDEAPVEVLATKLLDFGIRNVIVTLGERGALWASAAGLRSFDAYQVSAADTTGAGDAFNAGLVTRLAAGDQIEHAIDYGCRAGAYCVTKHGVIDGLASPSDLANLIL